MALRNIVEKGDAVLTKRCRPVTDFNDKLHTLLDDMAETLAKANGVGLAAPQVGILRRARPDGFRHKQICLPMRFIDH